MTDNAAGAAVTRRRAMTLWSAAAIAVHRQHSAELRVEMAKAATGEGPCWADDRGFT